MKTSENFQESIINYLESLSGITSCSIRFSRSNGVVFYDINKTSLSIDKFSGFLTTLPTSPQLSSLLIQANLKYTDYLLISEQSKEFSKRTDVVWFNKEIHQYRKKENQWQG